MRSRIARSGVAVRAAVAVVKWVMLGGPLNTHRVARVRSELRSGPRSQIASIPGSRAVWSCGPERMSRA
eukprot:8932293-Alexandrium_andersonii.AAC.1